MKKFKKEKEYQNGFTLIELLIVITVLAFIIAIVVPLVNTNMSNTQKRNVTNRLLASFVGIEAGFNNYVIEKNTYPTHTDNLLSNSTFVPSYLMPPVAPEGFNTSYGVNGFLVFNNSSGYYICSYVIVNNAQDFKFQAIKDIATKVTATKFYYNTSCPATSNASDPSSPTTLYPTYWIVRF